MDNFMIRFLICNIFISTVIIILLIIKRIFKNSLSSRIQYHLWFLFLALLTVPFLPFRMIGFPQIFKHTLISNIGTVTTETGAHIVEDTDWMNDFTLSVSSKAPSSAGYILLGIWIVGIFAMIILVIKSSLRLRTIKQSALPLQNPKVRKLYYRCLNETGIRRNIPIYSTAFLKSPVLAGFLKPCIYLPIHLISDYTESDMRYILLHELQHYRHKDALISYLMNFAGVIYWFHPLVWYALKAMRNDREIACDASVLKMLRENDYEAYGNTLINFVEKVSLTPFPFASGLSGNIKQIKRRIANIASYEQPTLQKKLKGISVFLLTALLLLGLAPYVSTYAAESNYYQWTVSEGISSAASLTFTDLSEYFGTYEGSFVLYDLKNDAWNIYNMEYAALRVAPDSTYKIYDALFGLEEGIITPDASLIAWNGEYYPYEAWNANQTLQSAMNTSVNWYFQTIDEQLGAACVYGYIQKIDYGNKNMSGSFPTYWLESSLKISPIEQVELLTKLYHNSFGFSSENVNAVKDSICLFSSDTGAFYGKTGTGRVDGQDVNGWFIGYIEAYDNTYFFATNIQADTDATGSAATEIALSILSELNIWR